MRVPLSWLSEFVDVPSDLDAFTSLCDMAGLEVEGIVHLGAQWDHHVVGEIASAEPIEGTHLHAVALNIGDGTRHSVCGAPNVSPESVGRRVAVALEGATITVMDKNGKSTPLTVEGREVRGHRSEAVLCSESEIGLSDDHDGILFLGGDALPGAPLADAIGDTLITFELTPDLGRCFSIHGCGREIAALLRQPLRTDSMQRANVGEPGGGSIPVTIADPNLCNRYLGAVIRNVTVEPSPDWMQRRLIAAGMRPINNVVDVSNYVLLEMGQPLHFFDVARIRGGSIEVRNARGGEEITGLDGLEYKLPETALIIADAEGPVAVAGIIGGDDSAVSESTRDVLLEAAHFHNHSVRRTTAALKLRTDAAERFIKDVDPEWTLEAMRRAIHLLLAMCPEARLEGYQDTYPQTPAPITLPIDEASVLRCLGIHVEADDIRDILQRFDFTVAPDGKGGWNATAPSYRKEVTHTADLIEEVARVVGLNNIPPSETVTAYLNRSSYDAGMARTQDRIAQILTGLGFNEAINYSVVSEQWNAFGMYHGATTGEPIGIANPIHVERTQMRRTLAPGLLENAGENLRYQSGVHLFELGRAYATLGETNREDDLFALLATGARRGAFWGESDPGTATGDRFGLFDLKGILESLFEQIGVQGARFTSLEGPSLTPGQGMQVSLGDETIGYIAAIDPTIAGGFGLGDAPALCAEIRLQPLLDRAATGEVSFARLTTQPPVYRDLSVIVPSATPVGDILDTVRDAAGTLLQDLQLFDRYQGEGVPDDCHSLAMSLTFQTPDRTLTAEEIDDQFNQIVETLGTRHGAQLRGA